MILKCDLGRMWSLKVNETHKMISILRKSLAERNAEASENAQITQPKERGIEKERSTDSNDNESHAPQAAGCISRKSIAPRVDQTRGEPTEDLDLGRANYAQDRGRRHGRGRMRGSRRAK